MVKMNSSPIIIIDDDNEDLELITQAFEDIKVENKIITFNDGYAFLDYIRTTDQRAFFIICDINMAQINGLELKKRIFDDERLRLKCVPFIFLSTSGASASVMRAYSFGVQGYFIKPNSFDRLKEMLQHIMLYWNSSQHPKE
jgi:CheY-like chemotaxis protein